jgi:hypothetical protein
MGRPLRLALMMCQQIGCEAVATAERFANYSYAVDGSA